MEVANSVGVEDLLPPPVWSFLWPEWRFRSTLQVCPGPALVQRATCTFASLNQSPVRGVGFDLYMGCGWVFCKYYLREGKMKLNSFDLITQGQVTPTSQLPSPRSSCTLRWPLRATCRCSSADCLVLPVSSPLAAFPSPQPQWSQVHLHSLVETVSSRQNDLSNTDS